MIGIKLFILALFSSAMLSLKHMDVRISNEIYLNGNLSLTFMFENISPIRVNSSHNESQQPVEHFFYFFLFIGIIFGTLGAVIAYLITYNEYAHRFKGRKLRKSALQTAIVTLIFFILLTLTLFFLLNRSILKKKGYSTKIDNAGVQSINRPFFNSAHSYAISGTHLNNGTVPYKLILK
jgi:sterol desaturase/sphingolipid hydroxylase (fatty acid hydroxylase superfamily)